MAQNWNGKFVLRPTRDHGDSEYFMAYATADTAAELAPLNAFDSAPRRISKETYAAALVLNSGRDVSLGARPGTVRMHTYQLTRILA